MCKGNELHSLLLRNLAECICFIIFRCKMHWYKGTSFYLIYKLCCTTHILISKSWVDRKHHHIHLFSLPLHLIALIHPVPVVQVACMKNLLSLNLNKKGDTYIGRSESINFYNFILILLTFPEPQCILFFGTAMFQDIF